MKNKLFKSVALGSLTVMMFSSVLPLKTAWAASYARHNRTIKAPKAAEQISITKDNFLDYFSFDSISNNAAKFDANTGIVTLNPDQTWKLGVITLKNYVDLYKDFKITSKMNIGNHIYGADGIGIGFHPGELSDIGAAGGALGFGKLANAFGWKADTYYNDSANGPYTVDPLRSNFGSFVYTDNNKNAISYMGADAPSQKIPDPNNTFKDFEMDYEANNQKLTVKYGDQSWSRSVSDRIDNHSTEAFFITASTGMYSNIQQVQIDSFTYYSKDSQANLTGDDVTIHVGDPIPNIEQFNPKATDEDGNPVDIANISVDTSKVDNKTAGD